MEVLHENGHEIRTASLVSLQSPLTALHPSPKPEASSNSPPLEIAPLMETFDILNPRSLQESLPLNHALHCLFPDKNAMGRNRAYFQGTLHQAIRDLAEPVGNPNQDPGMFDDFFNRFTHMFPGTGPNFYGDSATVDVQNVIDLVVMRWACDYLCGFGQVLDIPRNSGALATRLNGLDAVFGRMHKEPGNGVSEEKCKDILRTIHQQISSHFKGSHFSWGFGSLYKELTTGRMVLQLPILLRSFYQLRSTPSFDPGNRRDHNEKSRRKTLIKNEVGVEENIAWFITHTVVHSLVSLRRASAAAISTCLQHGINRHDPNVDREYFNAHIADTLGLIRDRNGVGIHSKCPALVPITLEPEDPSLAFQDMVIEEILHAILNLQDMVPEILPTTPRGVNRLGGTMLEIFNHPLEDSTLENASRDPDVLSIQITFTPNPEEEQEQKVVTKKPSQRWANQVEKFVHMVGTMGVFARKASTFLLGFLILYLTIRITTFAVVLIFRIAVWLFSPFAYLLALRAQVPTTPSDSSNTTTITIAAAAPRIQTRVEGPVQFMEVACPGPKTRIHDWEVVSFTLTSDQRVVPIEYTLDLANAHQVSMLDVDKQDTKMRVVVDGVVRGLTRDFDLNPDVDCGDGLGPGGFRNCMTMGHSVGQLTIPSGLHKVNIQYAGKEFIGDTEAVDWHGEERRRILWKKELCGPA